jgi:predicted nucleic acid-binding protein
MNLVFVDTVGLLALWDQDDQWHQAAETAWQRIGVTKLIPCTTPFVLLECANAASRRSYRREVSALREQFERAQMLFWPEGDEWRLAWEQYQQGKPGDAGVVDHVSFIVMRRLGISDAFTNDRHFKAAGI